MLRLMRTQYRREQAPALRLQKNFVTVGAIHESPVIICKRIVGCDYGMERPTFPAYACMLFLYPVGEKPVAFLNARVKLWIEE